MSGLPILSILIALPLAAGAACLMVKANAARWIALIATLIEFALTIWLWQQFDPNGAQWQFVDCCSRSSEKAAARCGLSEPAARE